MTSHRESTTITAVISALTHSNISTKKSALEVLKTALDAEQVIVDEERDNLHAHRSKVTSMITNLTDAQDGEEYTVLDAQGVFSAGEKTQILADVAALQAPITPTVYSGLDEDEDFPLLVTDKIVFIKHDQVTGITIVLPSDSAEGAIMVIKNFHIGTPDGGDYSIVVVPAPGQTPAHTIDFKFTSLVLLASTSSGSVMDSENEACRLVFLNNSWTAINDSY